MVADDGHGALNAQAGTAEPAMASSIDTVTGVQVSGPTVLPVLQSELELARAFGWHGALSVPKAAPAPAAARRDVDAPTLQWLGAGAIHDALLEHIAATRTGDSIDIAASSLSDRAIIAELLAASHRAVTVRLIPRSAQIRLALGQRQSVHRQRADRPPATAGSTWPGTAPTANSSRPP